jgi:aryl-alcohol dehydrogenase-like predicted oxidoreductase
MWSKCLEQALRHLPREKVQVATKCGIAGFDASGMCVKGSPEYVRDCCEASLKRLAVNYIDLYFLHRIDQLVPIEETVCIT